MTVLAKYDPAEWMPKILARMAGLDGEARSLNRICKEPGVPSKGVVLAWVKADPDLADQYAHARAQLMASYAEDIVDIADDNSRDTYEVEDRHGNVREIVDHDVVQRSKLRIEARKWLLSKVGPKVYRDKPPAVVDQSQHIHLGGDALADLAKDPAIRAAAIKRLHAGDVEPLGDGHTKNGS